MTDAKPVFIVQTDTSVCPDLVDPHTFGNHSSRIIERGVRRWVFEEEAGAELFTTYANRGEFRRKAQR